jgi:DNA-binding HxlR family transcriptional regulator
VPATGDYCSFTKAVEQLGDRWSLVILRDLVFFGPRGFNALATGLPGISRSVLAARLRKLTDLGLVRRDTASAAGGVPGYAATPGGEQLRPVLIELRSWSERWLPEDPAMVERDPDIIIGWLAYLVDAGALPEGKVVLDLDITGTRARRAWIVLERGAPPSVCAEDPCLDPGRYVFLVAGATPEPTRVDRDCRSRPPDRP